MKSNAEIIEEKLGKLYFGYIYHFNFNPKDHELTFQVRVFHETYTEIFNVKISEIITFLFHLERPEWDSPLNWEKMELGEIGYFEPATYGVEIDDPTSHDQPAKFTQKFNIMMDIWFTTGISIKANKLKINDEEFILK